jgi:ankyrin repeat protein
MTLFHPAVQGGNLRKKDRQGQNTLHWAARGGHASVVQFVLEHQGGSYANSVGHTSPGSIMWEADN